MITLEESRRLAFSKYLLTLANAQSKQPEPLASAALLGFHDAIEFFLQVTSEKLNVGKPKIEFLEYWDLITPKLAPNELPQRESMRRLNKARVALKHHGTHPSRLDMDDFCGATNRFMEQATQLVFGVSISEISLVQFVICEEARLKLIEAIKNLTEGKLADSCCLAALAFDALVSDYENRKRDQYHRSPFFFGESLTFESSFFMGISGDRKMSSFVDKVRESIEAMQKTIKMVSLGLDFRKFTRFNLLTPEIIHFIGGQRQIVNRFAENYVLSADDASFCIDFVMESAFELQEFDFDVPTRKNG